MLQIGTSKYPFLRGKKKQQKKFEGHYVDMYEKVVKKAGFFAKNVIKLVDFFLPKLPNLPNHFYRPFGKTFLPGLPVIYRYRVRSTNY